jgi:hypothetical protein
MQKVCDSCFVHIPMDIQLKAQADQQEAERKLRVQQEAERKLRVQQEAERKLREQQEAEHKLREQQEAERKLREQQEAERKLREQQEAERKLREQQEAERKLQEQQEAERKLRVQQGLEPDAASQGLEPDAASPTHLGAPPDMMAPLPTGITAPNNFVHKGFDLLQEATAADNAGDHPTAIKNYGYAWEHFNFVTRRAFVCHTCQLLLFVCALCT